MSRPSEILMDIKAVKAWLKEADYVPVVRCGKCRLRYKPLDDDVRNEIYCEFIGSTMRKDDFCSYGCADGERRDPCSSQDS